MEYSNEWLCFRKAEEEYFTSRQAFLLCEEDVVVNLKKALDGVGNNETALRLLRETAPSVATMEQLLPEVVDLAVDSGNLNSIGLARAVLIIHKDEHSIREGIRFAISGYLIGDDEWHYRRIAELYKLLNYGEELANFLMLCQANDNLEIQKIAADFHSV